MRTDISKSLHLPIVSDTPAGPIDSADADIDVDAALAAFEESERERLGIKQARKQWVDSMVNPEVKKAEREEITILQSGLTAAQDFLVEGALAGLGYKVKFIGMADNAGLQVGKEFGNRGQCNPTYFTVGNLVKYLIDLRDNHGMTAEEVIRKNVFLTAGACGPCRFGMYVTEYRKALRDAGFDGFRVMLFQQKGGLAQATGTDVGIEFNPPFFIAIVKSIVCGDVLNALAYRIRPYEVMPGATNAAVEESKRILYQALNEKTSIFAAIRRCKRLFEVIEVDRLRPKAKTSIIGEFWAMTTEGDGNYHLQKFLESEGAENDIQLTTAWLLYNIWEVARDTRERWDLRGADGGKYGLEKMDEIGVAKRLATMRLAEGVLRTGFQAFAIPLGLYGYHLPDMDLVADVAKDYYSNDLRGGEGHMEVGKLIVNAVHSKAHVTVSVKPFGCMPSSGVSDGVQSLITARFPGTIFCAVETSGDGATNFYSRVQMYLFKARIAAEEELQEAYKECGVTEAQVREYLKKNKKYGSPLHHPPHQVAGTAANLVYEVAPLITKSAARRALDSAKAGVKSVRTLAAKLPGQAKAAWAFVSSPENHQRLRMDGEVLRDLLKGKLDERFGPMLQKLAGRAAFGDGHQAEENHAHGEKQVAQAPN